MAKKLSLRVYKHYIILFFTLGNLTALITVLHVLNLPMVTEPDNYTIYQHIKGMIAFGACLFNTIVSIRECFNSLKILYKLLAKHDPIYKKLFKYLKDDEED